MDNKFELDQSVILKKIEKMYHANDINDVTDLCTNTQLEIFKNEINLLKDLGLRKEISITPDLNEKGDISSANKLMKDGKVDRHLVVSSGKIIENIFQNNKRVYRKKTKNAFINMFLIKSNVVFSDKEDAQNYCRNCGSKLKKIGTGFKCYYCETEYKGETTKWMLSRFYYNNAFRGISNFFVMLLIVFLLVALYQSGIFVQNVPDFVFVRIYLAIATVLTVLFFVLSFYSLHIIIKSKIAEMKIKKKDKIFSKDIFMQHILDLLQMDKNIINEEKKIIRAVDGYMYIENYRVVSDKEFVTVKCMLNTLNFKRNGSTIKIKEQREKHEFDIYRNIEVLSKIYYEPDQFTCVNCGSHQLIKYKKVQKCSYCKNEIDMSKIDWVLE